MTTLSSDAERLAAFLEQFKTCGHQLEDGTPVHLAAAALLRRIPELEAELESAKLGESFHDKQANEYARQVAHWIGKFDEVKAERDQLRAELEKVRVPEGWKLVPVKPTEKMVEVGYAAINCKATSPTRLAWNAMITAAPTPPHADQKGQ